MNPFKNSGGQFLLKALFYENEQLDKTQSIYTLKDEDHLSYPSLYRLYMEEVDPTEYSFATKHLGGWTHWQRLCDSEWFKPHVTRWREEFSVREKAMALLKIKEIANTKTPAAMTANKYIMDGGWESVKAPTRKVGRPQKEKIIQMAELLESEKELLEDTNTNTNINRMN